MRWTNLAVAAVLGAGLLTGCAQEEAAPPADFTQPTAATAGSTTTTAAVTPAGLKTTVLDVEGMV